MQRWEYCEVTWQFDQIVCSIFSARGGEKRSLEPTSWGQLLADLGNEGWELAGVTSSPLHQHEYFFYFKRSFAGPSDPTVFFPPLPPLPM